ncbi:hypothetical protein SLW70_14885 [Flavobacterium sp. NG2]|uniref:hypothetical protein n=1 Tax=Flavobacterium sp. NG2 TaxID=3097547 RepID=UPI002A815331|nr:hypothetical protein [Flavobacterium sp. NG2]WPR71208.1 hypothetical protein SLW70_14885 [Flavobacterium sp. NG2]
MELQISKSRHKKLKKKKLLKWTSIALNVLMINWIASKIGSASKYVTEAGNEVIHHNGPDILSIILVWIGIAVVLWFMKIRIKR